MTVRDIKLSIACGHESDEIKALNKFFDDLFSDLSIYTMDGKPDLIFMKGDKFIMRQDLENGHLWCCFWGFWSVLQDQYHCAYTETQDIVQYKVEEAFKMKALTPNRAMFQHHFLIEDTFKMGLLTHTEHSPYEYLGLE